MKNEIEHPELELVEALSQAGEHLESLIKELEEIRDFIKGGWAQDFELNEIRILLLRALPYGDYLKTKHWKGRRSKALSKTDKCAVCGKGQYYSGGTNLEVHHRTYDNLGEEKDEDLVVLCHLCHAKFHEQAVRVKSLPPR